MKTTVVNCRTDITDVYCGRPSIYGNPFILGKDGDRDMVCDLYEKWVMKPEQEWLRISIRSNLRGKRIGCYCSPLRCHLDSVAKIADGEFK